jgi:uncharacterized protein YbaP (TraB family)
MPSIASVIVVPVLLALFVTFGCTGSGSASRADGHEQTDHRSQQSNSNSARPRMTHAIPSPVHPPYFRIKGAGGADLLVMGSIHLGPPPGWTFSSDLSSGMKQADAFVLEIDLRKVSPQQVATILAERVVLPVSVTIDDVLSPETNQLLIENEALLTEFGLPHLARRRLKPWFIAVGLIEAATTRSGYSTERSVEQMIIDQLAGRPLMELETFDLQLAIFDSLSANQQDVMLNDTVRRLEETVDGIDELALAWSLNDQKTLEQIAYQGMNELPELESFYDVLLRDRNRNWVGPLREMLEDPTRVGETIFVAVGALHLVGPDNLIGMLAAEGYSASVLHPTLPPSP